MFTFYGWDKDELHTVCTLAGQGVKAMEKQRKEFSESFNFSAIRYMDVCIKDAEALLQNAVNALEAKD